MKVSQPAIELKDQLINNYGRLSHEVFVVAFLDKENGLISLEVLFTGDQGRVVSDSRVIFGRAKELGAASIIIAHNHPVTPDGLNDLPRPSIPDMIGIWNIRMTGEFEHRIGVRDALIIGEQEVFSMREGKPL